MSALGQERTSGVASKMSALPPKADIRTACSLAAMSGHSCLYESMAAFADKADILRDGSADPQL